MSEPQQPRMFSPSSQNCYSTNECQHQYRFPLDTQTRNPSTTNHADPPPLRIPSPRRPSKHTNTTSCSTYNAPLRASFSTAGSKTPTSGTPCSSLRSHRPFVARPLWKPRHDYLSELKIWCSKCCGKCFSPNNARWIVQALVITFLGSLCVLIRPIDRLIFRGSGYYVVFSALAVLESNTGSCLRKSFGRMLGTVLGGFSGCAIFILASWNLKQIDERWFPYVLAVSLLLFVLPWGIIRLRFRQLHYLCQYAVATGLMVQLLGYARQGRTFELAATRSGAVAVGVALNAAVVHTVFPNHARPTLLQGLGEVYRTLADVLQPAIDVSSGYLTSASLRNQLGCCGPGRLPVGTHNFCCPNSRPSGNNSSYSSEPQQPSWLSSTSAPPWETMVKRLERCQKLFMQEASLTEAARNELRLRRPRVFRQALTTAAYAETGHLFFHVASLVYSLDAQMEKLHPANHHDSPVIEKKTTHVAIPVSSTPTDNEPEFYVAVAPFLRHTGVNASPTSFSSDASTDFMLTRWSRVFGPRQQRLMAAISDVLLCFADYVVEPSVAQRARTRAALKTAGGFLEAFHEARKQHTDTIDIDIIETEAIHRSCSEPRDTAEIREFRRALQDQVCLVDETATAVYDQLLRCYRAVTRLCEIAEQPGSNRIILINQ